MKPEGHDVMDRALAFTEIVLADAQGRSGLIGGTLTFRPRGGGTPIEVDIVARSEHHGWPVTAHDRRERWPDVTAGLESATFHPAGKADPVVTLTWPPGTDDTVPRAVDVSDLPRLLEEPDYQRAIRALYGILPALGRPIGSGLPVEALVAAIRDLGASGDRDATSQRRVAELLDVSEDTVKLVGRASGGWEAVKKCAARRD
jgi:hypothetical protein